MFLDNKMTIGQKIKALRLANGISQKEFAKMISISPQAISKWENEYTADFLHRLWSCCSYNAHLLHKAEKAAVIRFFRRIFGNCGTICSELFRRSNGS